MARDERLLQGAKHMTGKSGIGMSQNKNIAFNEISQERIRELVEIARRKREEVQVELDRLKVLTEKDLQYRIE